MKMIKKLLVAVLAMAMVLGTMAVSAFAAEVKITVEWAEDDNTGAIEGASLWIWGATGLDLNYTESQKWPGDALTKNDDGTWSGTFTVEEDAFKIIPTVNPNFDAGNTMYQTVDSDALTTVDGGEYIVKVGALDEEKGQYTIESITEPTADTPAEDTPAEDTPAGDSTSVMGYVVAAVVALAAVVTVISKKRSVEA